MDENENPMVVVMWPDDGRMMTHEKFEGMRRVEGAGVWMLAFPFLLDRNWAPKNKQLAWAGDILLHLRRAGFYGQVLIPRAFQH